MTPNDRDDEAGGGKASFDHLYNSPDPRAYFRALGPLGYQIPRHAQAVFAALWRARGEVSVAGGGGCVLDVCCSYGVNAALLGCEVGLEDLVGRYTDASLAELSAAELAVADRAFYAERRRRDAPRVLGLDVAAEAVGYGREVGLLDAGWAEDLETSQPSAALVEEAGTVGLVTVTGGVGDITEATFDRLLGAFPVDRPPWVAAFVLRMYPYDAIVEALAGHGLVTEQLSGTTFRQRRFASSAEQDAALQGVRARGLDTTGKEDDGGTTATSSCPAPGPRRPAGRCTTCWQPSPSPPRTGRASGRLKPESVNVNLVLVRRRVMQG